MTFTPLLRSASLALLASSLVLMASAARAQNDNSSPGATSGATPGQEQKGPTAAERQQAAPGAIPTGPAPAGGAAPAGVATETARADAQLPSGRLPEPKPIPLVSDKPVWNTFHGQLNAQKYSPLTQITADNVGSAEKAWEYHTGDVSDGSRRHAGHGLVGNADLRQRHALHRHAVLSDHRARSGDRQGEMDLRHQVHAQGPDPAGAEEPRRRLLAGGEPGRRRALPEDRLHRHHGRAAVRRGCRHRQALHRISAMAACSTSISGTPPTTTGRCRCCSRRPSSATT